MCRLSQDPWQDCDEDPWQLTTVSVAPDTFLDPWQDDADPWQPFPVEIIARSPVETVNNPWQPVLSQVVAGPAAMPRRDSFEDPWQPAFADPWQDGLHDSERDVESDPWQRR